MNTDFNIAGSRMEKPRTRSFGFVALALAGLLAGGSTLSAAVIYRNSLDASQNTLSSVSGWSTTSSFSGQTPASVSSADTLTFTNFWTPSRVSPVAWLDAAAGNTLTTTSGTVSSWADRAGGSVSVTQSVSTARPAVVTNAMNGNPVVRFDGTEDRMRSTGNLFSGASDFSTFSVVRLNGGLDADGRGAYAIENNDTGSGQNGYFDLIARNNVTNNVRSLSTSDGTSANYALSTPPSSYSVGETLLSGLQRSGTQQLSSWNGSAATQPVAGQSTFTGGSNLRVGNYYTGTGYLWQGDIAEIVVTGTFLNMTDRQLLEGYLAWKWGTLVSLPADHPYKNAAPVSATETVFLGGNQAAAGLVFSAVGSATTLRGGTSATPANQTLMLNSGGITVNAGAGATTLGDASSGQVALAIGADQSWTNNSAALLRVYNGIARATGDTTSRVLTVTGSGNTQLDGAISNGGSAGTLGLTKSGAGTLTLTGSSSYTGNTTVGAGTMLLATAGTIGSSPTIQVDNLAILDVSAKNGSGGWTLGSSQTLKGSGTVAGVTTVAGTLSPGASPGTLFFTGSQTWASGGNYNWQVLNAAGAAGTGYDTTTITGTLDLTSLPADGFNLNLWSLVSISPSDVSGNALNFDNTGFYSWPLVTAAGGITGFKAADFAIHSDANNGTDGFSNALAPGGHFWVSQSGNVLLLNYIPEPASSVLFGLAGLLCGRRRRRE